MLESKSLKVIKKKPSKNMNTVLRELDRQKKNAIKVRINEDDTDFGMDELLNRSSVLYGGTGEQSVFGNVDGCTDEQEEEVDDAFDSMDYSDTDVDLGDLEDSDNPGEFNMGGDGDEVGEPEEYYNSNNYSAFDPRICFFDSFVSENNMVVPFATDTAASAYYDMVFTIESKVAEAAGAGGGGSTGSADGVKSSDTGTGPGPSDSRSTGKPHASDKVAPNTDHVNELSRNPDVFGVQSLMNNYTLTRLIGGLRGSHHDNLTTHMYDIRDRKRFYDPNIVEDADDFTSIGNPTTTNIIQWSNKDFWGRTPYRFTDFVFCKYWNIIPNNRLLTLRKYAVPVYDNLNFPNMYNEDGITPNQETNAAPIATVVSYFDGESANKLSDFMQFTTGTKWRDINGDVHQVSGNEGSNPRAVIDSMFENTSGFGGVGSGSSIVNSFLGTTGGVTGKVFSFGKFVGLLHPEGYKGHSQNAFLKLSQANMDPSESLYSNKIIGPVNRIMSTKARDAGIEFSQSFNMVCEYISRPIAGVNTKAAMLDILANCMEIASPDAVWWGGGYRFMIEPKLYPFKREGITNTMMQDLYAGKIFGNNGAIAHGLDGLVSLGKKDGSSSFEWSTVTENLGSVISQTVGAIGNMLQSISSTLFGESSTLSGWLNKATDALSSEENQKKGTEKLNSMFGNLNKMWKDQVIQQTTMPNIQGLKAILTGEPTGNWHLTVGNPLNPIMVVGNLICTKMTVDWDTELGPDDFPMGMKVTYTLEHGMARDKAGIQSMFNRGSGRIYKLPDYIKASSDYESKVDDYTGRTGDSWWTPKYMSTSEIQNQAGAHGWQVYKMS